MSRDIIYIWSLFSGLFPHLTPRGWLSHGGVAGEVA